MSNYEYPADEFDSPTPGQPDPVGVHRAPVPAWRSWVPLLAILIIVPLLAWGAVTMLGSNNEPSAASSPVAETSAAEEEQSEETQDAEAATDQQPAADEKVGQQAESSAAPANSADFTTGVTILNGSGVNGLAGRTGDRLTNAGYSGISVPSGVYSRSEPQQTTIYYRTEAQRPTAEALGQALGVSTLVESAAEAQSNPIVIVLRADFQE